MKKLMIKLSLALLLAGAINASALTATITVAGGGYVQLLSVTNGAIKITQIIATATSTTNASALFIDAGTNSLSYIVPAYTNRVSYATNYITSWTNYYGVAVLTTNIDLVDVNNSVASVTNNWPQRLNVAALAGTSTVFSGVNYYFQNGCWVSNTVAGAPIAITVTYQQ